MKVVGPLAPRRLTWAIAGRVVGKALQGFMLVLLVALVAWPESRHHRLRCQLEGLEALLEREWEGRPGAWLASPRCDPLREQIEEWPTECYRDASLSLLPDLLGM